MVTMVLFKSLVLLFLLPICLRANEIESKTKSSDPNESQSKPKPLEPKPLEPNEVQSKTKSTASNEGQSKTKSSEPIDNNEVPWLVSVQVDDWHSCIGSIIGQNWVLTTAYCIFGKMPKTMTIRVGSPSHLNGGSVVHVKRLIQNEKYVPTDYDYDFGLIELTEKLVYTKSIQSIRLPSPNDDLKDGTLCTVYSWGMTTTNSGSNSYQNSIVPIVNHKSCSKMYEPFHAITERMICAGKNSTVKKTCRDDYGAPLTWKDPESLGVLKLIGLVSFSKGCGDPNYPTVFANVESVRSWITKYTKI